MDWAHIIPVAFVAIAAALVFVLIFRRAGN